MNICSCIDINTSNHIYIILRTCVINGQTFKIFHEIPSVFALLKDVT